MTQYIKIVQSICALAITICTVILLAQCKFSMQKETSLESITLPSAYFTALFDISVRNLEPQEFAQAHGFVSCIVEAESAVTLMAESEQFEAIGNQLLRRVYKETQIVQTLPEISSIGLLEDGAQIAITLDDNITQAPETIIMPLALLSSAVQAWHGNASPEVHFTILNTENIESDNFVLYGDNLT